MKIVGGNKKCVIAYSAEETIKVVEIVGAGRAKDQHMQPLTASTDWLASRQAEAGCGKVCLMCVPLDSDACIDMSGSQNL